MSLEDQAAEEYFSNIETTPSIKPNVKIIMAESMAETKRKTMNQLLSKVDRVDYIGACEELGWRPTINKDGSANPPTQSNYKVAIIDQLMITAKNHNWHLALDTGLFYIYSGSMWISLDKDELKNFLKDVAIKQSYPQIKARDSKFIVQLYDQAIQDGFFTDKNYTQQSMINLNNGTLVLNSDGVKVKKFDYRDFLTHQLPFNYDSKSVNTVFFKIPFRSTTR